jgi:hypothetical protein
VRTVEHGRSKVLKARETEFIINTSKKEVYAFSLGFSECKPYLTKVFSF